MNNNISITSNWRSKEEKGCYYQKKKRKRKRKRKKKKKNKKKKKKKKKNYVK